MGTHRSRGYSFFNTKFERKRLEVVPIPQGQVLAKSFSWSA